MPERLPGAAFLLQFRVALVVAWFAASLLSVPVSFAPFVVPAGTLLRWAPVCARKAKYGQECALCGMTHAFILISQGHFAEASHRNRGSFPLYFGLLGNQLLAARLVVGFRRARPEGTDHGAVRVPALDRRA